MADIPIQQLPSASASSSAGGADPPEGSADEQQNVVSLGSLLSTLSSFQGAHIGVPDGADSSSQSSLNVPRIQLRITSSNGLDGTEADSANDSRVASQREAPSLSRTLLRHLSRSSGRGSGQGTGTDDGPENLAAAAERHRLNNTTVIDLQATARWLESSLCFLSLLLLVFVYHHIIGILSVAWLTLILFKANDFLRRQVALKEQRNAFLVACIGAVLTLHIVATLYAFKKEALWKLFVFIPPNDMATVWDAFFAVGITDILIRLCTMLVKAAVLVGCKCSPAEAFRRRGQILTCIEHITLLYRVAVPTPVWYKYYDTRNMPSLLFSLCTGLYVMFKCSAVYERTLAMVTSFKTLVHPEGQYGQLATPDEVAEAGNSCSICQDVLAKPIKLRCTHIFCEACIAEWFEREQTCPMCRAVAKPAGLPNFGDCSTSLLPQLF